MFKSILGVLGGLITTIVLSGLTTALIQQLIPGTATPPFPLFSLLFALLYNFIFSFLGGWVTAKIAGRHEVRLAVVAGVIILVLSFGGEFIASSPLPLWYKAIVFFDNHTGICFRGTIPA